MKKLSCVIVALAALSSPLCLADTFPTIAISNDARTASSVDASDPNRLVATLRGTSGIASVQNDKIELRNGAVYVNERSYGAVPANAEIKYIVTPTERQLLVNGKRRAAPPASR